jgi:hypothetical protein
MKNNNTNTSLRALALLFILQSSNSNPIHMPACLMEFNTGTGENYIKNCQKIDEYVKKVNILNFSYTNTHNKTNTIKSIHNQLAAFETELCATEQQALLAIKEKYQVSNEIWQKYMADLHRMKIIYTKSMKKSHPDAIHDPNIPADILEILLTLLEQNGINPHSINLTMISDQAEIDKNPHTIAHAINYISVLESSEDLTISYNYKPSTIGLFPKIIEQTSISHITSTCAHEIQHILQHHHLTGALLTWYLHHYYNVDCTNLKKTPEFHKLSQIHEAQAEILSAIKDPKIAECLKIKRETVYYPDHLYEEHFFQLAHIDMLWQARKWLENLS